MRDREHGAQDQNDVEHRFKNSAAFFFRPDQQSVSRFELVVHMNNWIEAIRICNRHATQQALVVSDSFRRKSECERLEWFHVDVPRLGTGRSVFGTFFIAAQTSLRFACRQLFCARISNCLRRAERRQALAAVFGIGFGVGVGVGFGFGVVGRLFLGRSKSPLPAVGRQWRKSHRKIPAGDLRFHFHL